MRSVDCKGDVEALVACQGRRSALIRRYMALAATRSHLVALEAGVVLEGVLLDTDVVGEAEGWRQ